MCGELMLEKIWRRDDGTRPELLDSTVPRMPIVYLCSQEGVSAGALILTEPERKGAGGSRERERAEWKKEETERRQHGKETEKLITIQIVYY